MSTCVESWIEPDLQQMLDRLSDAAIFALTLYGDARLDPIEGIVACANVIIRRRDDPRWPSTIKGVCLQPGEFLCWHRCPDVHGKDNNHDQLVAVTHALSQGREPKPPSFARTTQQAFEECAAVATMALRGALRDRTKQATHCHSVKAVPRPRWAQSLVPVSQIGLHVFYIT